MAAKPNEPNENQPTCTRCLFNTNHLVIQHKVNIRKATNVTKLRIDTTRNLTDDLSTLLNTSKNLKCKNIVLNSIDRAASV